MRVIDTADVKDVQVLAFAPDGRYLAAAAHGRGLVVHDLTGGAPVRIGPDGFAWRAALAFEPAGALVTITTDGVTRFDLATGDRRGVGPFDPDGPRPLIAIAASAEGARLLTVQYWHQWNRLVCWNAVGGEWVRGWFVEDERAVTGPTLSAAGNRVAVVAAFDLAPGTGYRLQVIDADSGAAVGAGSYPFRPLLTGPQFRPDGRQIVLAHPKALVIWDARVLGKPVLIRNDSRRSFTAAAYHPSGRYLFTTSNDATVSVWDTEDWVRVRRFDWDVGRLRSVAVSPDGLLAAAGSDRGRVVVWDVDV